MSRYRSQTEFQVSDDHTVVYNRHPDDPRANELTVEISAPTLPDKDRADVADLIKRSLATRQVGAVYDTVTLSLDLWSLLQNATIAAILAVVFLSYAWTSLDNATAAAVTGVIVGAGLSFGALVVAAIITHNKTDSTNRTNENVTTR